MTKNIEIYLLDVTTTKKIKLDVTTINPSSRIFTHENTYEYLRLRNTNYSGTNLLQ